MKNYNELFSERGRSYDRAMYYYPYARCQEFLQALNHLQIYDGMRVADIPAGGEYLRKFISAKIEYFPHEPCDGFQASTSSRGIHQQMTQELLPLPWGNSFLDLTISIAGIHHIENKLELFQEIYRVTKSKGQMLISDVEKNSKVAFFLDNYVGQFNSTGHDGIYLDSTTALQMSSAGWCIETTKTYDFYWVFRTRYEMGDFCHQLFDIQHANINDTVRAIEEMLGVEDLADGGVGMNWSLLTLLGRKA